jgi:Ca2+-binding RTX toxin-like protein
MRLRAVLILVTMSLGVLVLSGVALAVTKTCITNPCEGTSGPDTLTGTASKNQIYGRPDADYIAGRAAADNLYGNRGNDEVWGEGGSDFIDGGMHSDSDTLYGGIGNDTIRAVDELNGWKDYIDCGDGEDTAYVDELDVVGNCENVFRAPPEEPV